MRFSFKRIFIVGLIVLSVLAGGLVWHNNQQTVTAGSDLIKWAEFDVPYSALKKASDIDIATYEQEGHINWIELLSLLGTKYGGDWSKYKTKDMDAMIASLQSGERDKLFESKYYDYYHQIYECVLNKFLGKYELQTTDENGNAVVAQKYGLMAFSPIANGFSYSHYDDFGNSRSYGFKRRHLGNDLMGSIGTPIIAVESGIVEAAAWNQYGGWRIGIRSYDNKRYYYYAHLKKDKPFHTDIIEGSHVKAGDVIGYLGMTGYSTRENVNNINTPHLHFGMQLIFDESQKESNNEIWVNVYEIVRLLSGHKSDVIKDQDSGQYFRKNEFYELE